MFKYRPSHVLLTLGWSAVALALLSFACLLTVYGHKFSWLHELKDMPATTLALGGVAAGAVFAALAGLIPAAHAAGWERSRRFLAFIVAVGLGMRAILLLSTPALEDDFYRYLWDGGVAAHGLNPYAYAPDAVYKPQTPDELKQLALQSGAVIERVNHAHLKTIYPPVAQAWFALAHVIEPWSLLAWRLLGLAAELITLSLLLVLLNACGRSPLWVALYWWNPVVAKELINSAHMEFVLLPIVLTALWLGARRYYSAALLPLALAIGTKLWPVMLLPLFLRPLLQTPLRLLVALVPFGALCLAWAIPPYLGGIDETSGFVAFARYWQTNSALFQNLNALVQTLILPFGFAAETTGVMVRLGLAGAVAMVALTAARSQYATPQNFVIAAAWVIGAQFLLSPVQFPWYATWIFIMLPFVPLPGLIAITVTIPLYYMSFHFAALGRYDLFNGYILWLIWLPVWLLLARDAWRVWRPPLTWQADARG